MIERALRIESHGFFRARDGRVMLLGFVVRLRKKPLDFGVARTLLGGLFQELRRSGVIAGVVRLVRGLQAVIAQIVRGPRIQQKRGQQKRGKESDLYWIRFGHECSSHRCSRFLPAFCPSDLHRLAKRPSPLLASRRRLHNWWRRQYPRESRASPASLSPR